MTEDFMQFLANIRYGISNGTIKVSKELTDFDLAVQYAIAEIGKRKGYPCNVTLEEIFYEVDKFANELLVEGE